VTTVLPDDAARQRIRTDLSTNLLVEAGAGSGKTTALVSRLLQHVLTGTPIEQIAAVTFTRKAADELRERLQLRLEAAAGDASIDATRRARCAMALRELDRGFLGTIHSFCARMLREHPLEAGLDPAFEEIPDADVTPMNRAFWRRWVDAARIAGDKDVREMIASGIDPADLHDAFQMARNYPDVDFAVEDVAPPDIASCCNALELLVARAAALMPVALPADGPDALMASIQRLRFQRSISDWADVSAFCSAISPLTARKFDLVQKRWSDTKDGKAAAKALSVDLVQWLAQHGEPVQRAWREYRYPIVIRVLTRAVEAFTAERHDAGLLGFDDLLLLCAKMLREHGNLRDELGQRFRFLLVDEFQDTDPVQAEVCLLLASESSEGTNWHTVTPRAGALFVVGDPKQSIYRFRRADIQIYERVQQRFDAFGATLALTTNFRSVPAVGTLVNTYFSSVFPEVASAEQAAFSPLVSGTNDGGAAASGVFRYVIQVEPGTDIAARDAAFVAAWIAARIDGGERAGNFLVLTERRAPIAAYARALGDRNIPVVTTGAALTQEHELREVMIVLRALADPENPVMVVAALEGVLFGLTPADLWSARQLNVRFSIGDACVAGDTAVAQALSVLHGWWQLSGHVATDILLDRILDDTGLLCLAASLPLGDARAGALLHLVESVRSAGAIGQSGLSDAIGILDSLLDAEAEDAPLLPGRTDAVRVMNLHKAKGLEADIVVLAAPLDYKPREPVAHVVRSDAGDSRGALLIAKRNGATLQRIAQSRDWDEMAAAEQQFSLAEQDRLRYVAATRARRMLVVAQAEKLGKTVKVDGSIWRAFASTLDAMQAQTVTSATAAATGRDVVTIAAATLDHASRDAAQRVAAARVPTLRQHTVTGAQSRDDVRAEFALVGGEAHGREWGELVHRGLDALARGRNGASLRAYVGAIVAAAGCDEGEANRLYAELLAVQASPEWILASAAGTLQSELSVMQITHDAHATQVMQGVIDLAVCDGERWRILDWKSDDVSDAVWAARCAAKYDRQLATYQAMLTAVTTLAAAGALVRVGHERNEG
jgi:ATP-dependent helicase/nuclease subunit A